MRSLVVGAGIAGLTLGARLCQQARPPVIVEQAATVEGGYALGLYPLGSCVLRGLGTFPQLVERSLPIDRYELSGATGATLQSFELTVLTADIGPLLMISRRELLGVLESSCAAADLRRGITVTSLDQRAGAVEVEFSDGTSGSFDVVVACDGIDSATRSAVFGPVTGYDSGWSLWTWWADASRFDASTAHEWWAAGGIFGVYPAPGRVMCAAGGPTDEVAGDDPRTALREHLAGLVSHVPVLGGAINDLDDAHSWPMRDVRAANWTDRRVTLCGDAAVGFMPTAGVGASYALRAAAALADELSRADATTVPLALELYERRSRRTVERGQSDSRRLARVMFVRGERMAWARDQLVRRYPAKLALREIVESAHRSF